MDKVLFSVIIPLYNKAKYIERTIQSVLLQTISDFELIVIDDDSTDDGPQIVQRIRDPRIRLIHEENAGVSAARNLGIKESRGKIICFLDADDIWYRDFLETVIHLFSSFPNAGIVSPSYEVCYGKRIVHPVWRSVNLKEDSYVTDFYEMATAPFWIIHSSCDAIKREELEKMDHWFQEGETVYEDFDFWIRLGTICKAAHSNKICSSYNRKTFSNSRKTHSNKIVYSKSYMKTLDDLLKNENLSEKQKNWVKEIKDRRMVPYIFSLLLVNEKKEAKKQLKEWKPCRQYKMYKHGLEMCSIMPTSILNLVNSIRIKVF